MQSILREIIKEQNRQLLNDISAKYGLKDLERKYLTPSFYALDIERAVYEMHEVEKTSSISKCQGEEAGSRTKP